MLKRGTARYRFVIGSRALAAIGGGYALTAGFTTALALVLKSASKEEAIMLATMPGFLVWAGAIVWVFAARSATRAWVGVLVPSLICAAVVWFLRSGGAS